MNEIMLGDAAYEVLSYAQVAGYVIALLLGPTGNREVYYGELVEDAAFQWRDEDYLPEEKERALAVGGRVR